MNKRSLLIALPLSFLLSSSVIAADCTENNAADLNTQVETSLTLLEDQARESADIEGNIELQDQINALWEKFNATSDLQTQALDSNNQSQMDKVCESYQSILKEIDELGK